jgi:ABC-type multidrug transport system permease subunit
MQNSDWKYWRNDKICETVRRSQSFTFLTKIFNQEKKIFPQCAFFNILEMNHLIRSLFMHSCFFAWVTWLNLLSALINPQFYVTHFIMSELWQNPLDKKLLTSQTETRLCSVNLMMFEILACAESKQLACAKSKQILDAELFFSFAPHKSSNCITQNFIIRRQRNACINFSLWIICRICLSLISIIDFYHWFLSLISIIDFYHWFLSLISIIDFYLSLLSITASYHWFLSLLSINTSYHCFLSLLLSLLLIIAFYHCFLSLLLIIAFYDCFLSLLLIIAFYYCFLSLLFIIALYYIFLSEAFYHSKLS